MNDIEVLRREGVRSRKMYEKELREMNWGKGQEEIRGIAIPHSTCWYSAAVSSLPPHPTPADRRTYLGTNISAAPTHRHKELRSFGFTEHALPHVSK